MTDRCQTPSSAVDELGRWDSEQILHLCKVFGHSAATMAATRAGAHGLWGFKLAGKAGCLLQALQACAAESLVARPLAET